VWSLPVVFVVENNGFADFIRVEDHQRIPRIAMRADAYGMRGETVDGNDVEAVHDAARRAVEAARRGEGPTLLECVTYRWRGHFEGDPQPYRTQDEVEGWKARDPLKAAEGRLAALGLADATAVAAIRAEVQARVDRAVEFARAAPRVAPDDALTDVYTDLAVEGWEARR
jgi:TPP-dependent pyruvate/acetoin dehydrogenase alpha subunit